MYKRLRSDTQICAALQHINTFDMKSSKQRWRHLEASSDMLHTGGKGTGGGSVLSFTMKEGTEVCPGAGAHLCQPLSEQQAHLQGLSGLFCPTNSHI